MAVRFEMKLNVSKIQKEQITKFIEDQDWKDVIAGNVHILQFLFISINELII